MSYLYVAYVHKMFSVIACSYKKSIDDIKMFIKLGKPIRKQISSRTRSSLYNGKFAEFNVSDVRIKFPLIQTVGQLWVLVALLISFSIFSWSLLTNKN